MVRVCYHRNMQTITAIEPTISVHPSTSETPTYDTWAEFNRVDTPATIACPPYQPHWVSTRTQFPTTVSA